MLTYPAVCMPQVMLKTICWPLMQLQLNSAKPLLSKMRSSNLPNRNWLNTWITNWTFRALRLLLLRSRLSLCPTLWTRRMWRLPNCRILLVRRMMSSNLPNRNWLNTWITNWTFREVKCRLLKNRSFHFPTLWMRKIPR